MSKTTVYYLSAALIAGIIPIVPYILRLRIRILRFFRWQAFADWHERHARPIIFGVRIFMGALALYLLVMGLSS